jgi:hypothetical protein
MSVQLSVCKRSRTFVNGQLITRDFATGPEISSPACERLAITQSQLPRNWHLNAQTAGFCVLDHNILQRTRGALLNQLRNTPASTQTASNATLLG